MDKKYVIGIDQSTQGTKALLFDKEGALISRCDMPHAQIVNDKGWVSHNLNEIYNNVIDVTRRLLREAEVKPGQVACIGISNQRETTCMWNRCTGEPTDYAVVWQCSRAKDIESRIAAAGHADNIRKKTGIPLSAYYPACKMAWLLETHKKEVENFQKTVGTTGICSSGNEESVIDIQDICLGTIDSWLIFKLSSDHAFKTDYSNASRTQLFNIHTLSWDEELCDIFNIPMSMLPEVCDSDSIFGETTMDGLFSEPIPICGVLGDSHGALFGQGCHEPGMVKATYGTGSSVMMNIGDKPIMSENGMATSLAWKIDGRAEYVLEGNLNYTGAVITWLKDNLGLISSAAESETMARAASPADHTYLVPAFTGLGAPYWDSDARASFVGMSRTTGRAELVKAGLESMAYQITDLIRAMEKDTGITVSELRVDGGSTHNDYLMQFQSDLSGKTVAVPEHEELSGIGAAYAAGIRYGIYDKTGLFSGAERKKYTPDMSEDLRGRKYQGWKYAVRSTLNS